MNSAEIEIPLSKFKISLLLFVALAFVVGGVCFITNPSTFTDSGFHHRSKFEILIVGFACVVFFGVGVIILIFKLFDNKPGLLINSLGLTINPGSSSNSFIEWKDIENFGIIKISRTKLIAVYLKSPDKFISSLANPIKRKMALFSLNSYGTPISISTGGLKCNSDELCALLINKLKGQN